IPGNHDTDETRHYDHLFGSTLADRNLHGRIETIAGVRIAGLGGVFRTKVWDGFVESKESPQSFMKI
ncbi:MAG: metallophosphoesterase family protein, partial [Burkholderiaceae bacterium]